MLLNSCSKNQILILIIVIISSMKHDKGMVNDQLTNEYLEEPIKFEICWSKWPGEKLALHYTFL